MNPFRWLMLAVAWLWRKPLLWWVRARIVPDPPESILGEAADRPLCYVLPVRSWADRVVVESVVSKRGLPLPYLTRQRLPTSERAAVLFLPALGRAADAQPSELQSLVDAALSSSDYDVQLVPVSVYWGRDPGRETSLLKILFTDSDQAGWLRKFFIVLANGRNTLVSFSKPVSFSEFMADQPDRDSGLVKLSRILRLHFSRNRSAVLGPSRSNRQAVVRSLKNHPSVRAAMDAAMADEGLSREDVQAKVQRYGEEIAADYTMAAIRFMEVVLDWLWKRTFDGLSVFNVEQAREAAHDGGVVYLPSHRSHFDYLLVSYLLYKQGLAPPHIAAGINMNFWPVGGLLRRCGAFYLRRKFRGNRLYGAVFRAYVDALVTRGTPISFYPEGGRSRTGRLRRPMMGMLSMTVESALRNPDKPLKLVPVFLGYDRIMEVNSYFSELRGQKAKRESAARLIKAGRSLKRKYGRPYISFGEPVDVLDFINAQHPDWQSTDWAAEQRPAWWSGFVSDLGHEIMRRINGAAVVSPVALTAVSLLATQERAMPADELAERLAAFVDLLQRAPYGPALQIPEADGAALLARAEPIAGLQRVAHPWGELVLAQDKDAVLLTYYRNSIQHLFAMPSLIANFFSARALRTREEILSGARALYPILRDEWFLWDHGDNLDPAIERQVDAMVEAGMLIAEGDSLRRPDPSQDGYGHLGGLMRIMRETLERYAMTLVLLAEGRELMTLERASFESECVLMAERMAVLTGRNAPEFFDPALFRGHVNTLIQMDVLHEKSGEGDMRWLTVDAAIEPLARQALGLLGPEIAQTVQHLTGRRRRSFTISD